MLEPRVRRHAVEGGPPAPPSTPRASLAHCHDIRFYDDADYPAAAFGDHLAHGLRDRAAAIAVATPEHLGAIRAHLSSVGLDVDMLTRRGQLVFLSAERVLTQLSTNGVIDMARFDAVVGSLVRTKLVEYASLRVFGEVVDILCRAGRTSEAALLESSWSELCAVHPVAVLCAYGYSSFAGASSLDHFSSVCRQHGHVHPGSEADGDDRGRLLAHVTHRTRALATETTRAEALDEERRRLHMAEREAVTSAEAAHHHLVRLQRVTSALSEAATLTDVRRVFGAEMTESVHASSVMIAVASESGELALLGEPREPPEALRRAYATGTPAWPCPAHPRLAALPLGAPGRQSGAVAIELPAPRALSTADRALLEDLVRQLSLALDRATLYETAKEARDRAEEANRAKNEFLAMLGHELRNPLSPMLTALELMRLRAGDVALRERLVIERQLRHMVRLVDDLLDISRIERGAFGISRQPVETAEIVARAIEMASPLLEERLHHLSTSVPERGLLLDADPYRLAQAIANVLMNAAKYTPEGGFVSVTVLARGERVRILVKDDGVGIDPTFLPRIFDAFSQEPQSADRARGGLGLGLSIVKRIVELHGGTVAAESPGRGRGSSITIDLPLMLSPTSEPPPRAIAPPSRPAPAPEASGAPLRILVVDDNEDAAELLAEALHALGHTTLVAHDGPSALALVEDVAPDLAVLDIGLPVMDGYELAATLRSRALTRDTVLVALTGYGQRSDRDRAKAAGFDEHLVKPVDRARLDAIIDGVRRTKMRS